MRYNGRMEITRETSQIILNDEERTGLLMDHLRIIFRDRNKLMEVEKPDGGKEMLKVPIVLARLRRGVSTGEIRLEWVDEDLDRPAVVLVEGEGKEFVRVQIARKMAEAIFDDLEKEMSLKNIAYMDEPKAYIEDCLRNLANGRKPLTVEPEKLATTGWLREMLKQIYGCWRKIAE